MIHKYFMTGLWFITIIVIIIIFIIIDIRDQAQSLAALAGCWTIKTLVEEKL